MVCYMAKRRSAVGKKGKHSRSGAALVSELPEKRRKKMLLTIIVVAVILTVALASLLYFFILDTQSDEKKDVLTTDTSYGEGYPEEEINFTFTVHNPDEETDTFSPLVSGLPYDWEVSMPNTITVKGGKSIDQKFTIIPTKKTAMNKTYSFMLNVTSRNTQHTYTLEYKLTIFKFFFDIQVSTDTPNGEGYPNENITFNFTIYNPNKESDNFTANTTGLLYDWKIFKPSNISVDSNETKQFEFHVVPSLASAKNFTYPFMLKLISENTKLPYILIYNLTIYRYYGIGLICYNNSHDADPGRSTYYAIVVKNTGNGEDNITLSYNESHLPINWDISFEFDSIELPAFGSEVVICNITTDQNTAKGRYDIDIIASGGGELRTSVRLNTSLIKDFGDEISALGDKVQVDYTGTLIDGVIFDTSHSYVAHNSDYPKTEDFSVRPSYSPLKVFVNATDTDPTDDYTQVIEGFWEGIIGMKVDETKVVRIPPEKAYNQEGHPLYDKTLIFEITLVSIDS